MELLLHLNITEVDMSPPREAERARIRMLMARYEQIAETLEAIAARARGIRDQASGVRALKPEA